MDAFNESIQDLYRCSENYKIPRFLSQKFKISAGALVTCSIVLCLFLMGLGFYDKLLCDLLTFFFPAKWTIASIEIPTFASDKLWVTYWLIYSLLKLLDETIPFFIQFIPFYYPIKACFLIILFAPKIQGGLMIYNNLISPLIRSNKLNFLFNSSIKKKRASYNF